MNDYKIYAKLRNQARWETRRANSEFEKKLQLKLNKIQRPFGTILVKKQQFVSQFRT